jgi:hypothetical protein
MAGLNDHDLYRCVIQIAEQLGLGPDAFQAPDNNAIRVCEAPRQLAGESLIA